MNRGLSARGRRLPRLAMLAALAALIAFRAAAEGADAPEIQQYARVANKIKPASSTLSIDLPFAFDGEFVDEEIPEDMKALISSGRRCQMLGTELKMLITYTLFTNDYTRAHLVGVEDEWMRVYLEGSMIENMKDLDANGQISAFRYRVMDIKPVGSKDKALLLKGGYREGPQDYEVWLLQILHKKEVWQLLFFFDPTNVAMQDAVEAACFSAAVK